MRATYEETLYNLLSTNEKIVVLAADSGWNKYYDIREEYPERFFDFGIAENNMLAAAAGFAAEGFIPIVYDIGNFLVYRAYEFIRNDICIQNLNVKLVGMGAGVILNTAGPSHHTTEDIAVLRVLPNMALFSPASPKEVPAIVEESMKYVGPVYIRLGRSFETEIYDIPPRFEIGKSNLIKEGSDVTIIATGSVIANAIEAAKLLEGISISAEIINMTSLKPLDEEAIIKSAKKTGHVITLEEHQINGGLGGAVSEVLCTASIPVTFERMGFRDTFCADYGFHRELLQMYGLSPEHIFECCKRICGI
jgi:transketolase